MAVIETPWGSVTVPDDIPTTITCAMCGTCCRAFFLSVTDQTLQEWKERKQAGEVNGIPPDLDVVLELFVPLSEPPPTEEGSWFTCRAFDPVRNRCKLMETDPARRPQTCFAFPYFYDWASLHEVPYANCHIVQEAVRHLGGQIATHIGQWVKNRMAGELYLATE